MAGLYNRIKEVLIGRRLPTNDFGEEHHKLDVLRGLASFSPDALSSIAYANQEIYLGLVVAGAVGLSASFGLGIVITFILGILTLSYYQTIQAYPSGGGSWIVARENLGEKSGLVAAAALLIDYLLVAAVSLTAGVEAIASAFPMLLPYKIPLSIILLAIITVINLRGTREAGTLMTFPVYFFLITFILTLIYGVILAVFQGPGNLVAVAPKAVTPLTFVLFLHAFSSGSSALTGVEAISNGVPAFQEPKQKKAGKTLLIMSVLMAFLFIGSIGLTQYFAIIPGENETILSALVRRILGDGPLYIIVQIATLLILAVAANTSFADFPRVSALLASDSYLARGLANLGDRLVFANGMILLASAAALLIFVFGGNSHALIPLFAVGAFLAFTLSQWGMFMHWYSLRDRHWQIKAFLNGLGSIMTCTALLVISYSKFSDGAWVTIILIPLFVLAFLGIRQHYNNFDLQMSPRSINLQDLQQGYITIERAAIPVAHVNQGTVEAVSFAKKIALNIIGVHVELSKANKEEVVRTWEGLWPDIPLIVLPSPYRSVTEPLIKFLEETDKKYDGEPTALVLPTFVPAKWWQTILHTQTTWRIRQAILNSSKESGIERTIIEVPYLLKK